MLGPHSIRWVSLLEEGMRTQTRTDGQLCEKTAIHMPRREVSGRNSPADGWVSDFPPAGLGEKERVLFRPPSVAIVV